MILFEECLEVKRKRVSIAEALATRASVYCWDNATRGLDASTAPEYAQAIRASTNILKNVALVTLYQASENIYNLFDLVTVIYLGRQICFGPVQEAKEYFEAMGFECPARQTTAEFLTAITDPNARSPKPGYEHRIPRTVEDFMRHWKKSPQFQYLQRKRGKYNYYANPYSTIGRYQTVKYQDKMKTSRLKSRYLVSYGAQLRLGIVRGFQRLIGNSAFNNARVIASIIRGVVIGTLYLKISTFTSGAFSRSGVLYFALLLNSLAAMSQIGLSFGHREIFLKHKNYSFGHLSVEACQNVFTELPASGLVAVIFCTIVYFLSDLNRTAGQFFLFMLLILLSTFCLTIFLNWFHR